MESIPPISAEVELAIADAMADGLFTPVQSLLDAAGEADTHSGAESCPGWDCRDSTEWSPGMWWLLNWWTWQYPAPCIDVTIIDSGGHTSPSGAISTESVDSDAHKLGPALADLGSEEGRQHTPPPPIARQVIEQLVVRGDCIVDLLA